MSCRGNESTIDWNRLELPSDRLVIGTVRRLVGGNPAALDVILHNVRLLESEFVHDAIRLGHEPREPATVHVATILKHEKAKELAALYAELGLATGRHEAMRLVEGLDKAAIAILPKGPSPTAD